MIIEKVASKKGIPSFEIAKYKRKAAIMKNAVWAIFKILATLKTRENPIARMEYTPARTNALITSSSIIYDHL